MVRPILLAAVAALLCSPLPATAQSRAPKVESTSKTASFDKAEAHSVVRELASQIEADFVFPEVAKAYAQHLRQQLSAGAYDQFPDARAFAEAVTADLQAVHSDRHLRLHAPRLGEDGQARARQGPPGGNQVARAGWLAPGVAYVAFNSFPGNAETLDAVRRFLAEHEGAESLIIDARQHRGGGLAEMDLIFEQLFDSPADLVGMDTRRAVEERYGPGEESPRLRLVAGPDGVVRRMHFARPAAGGAGLANARLFLLTSNRTASAGEHLSLALKRTGRATLIGETTRGAGHYGGVAELPHGYSVFIPVGRSFDPDTGRGWETIGVEPHVQVAADEALDEALRRAGAKVSAEVALARLN